MEPTKIELRRCRQRDYYRSNREAIRARCNTWEKARRAAVPRHLKQSHKLTSEQKHEICQAYRDGCSSTELGIRYNLNPGSVRDLLRRRGLTRTNSEAQRKYSINEAAFDTITDTAAYWAGFLMTDGCITSGDGNPAVMLSVQQRDAEHLERFKQFLGSNHPVRHILQRGGFGDGHIQCCLKIRSSRLAASLAKMGVVPRKTETAEAIGVEMSPHFWRGCIDGDGSIHWTKAHSYKWGRRPNVSLVGISQRLLEQFCHFVRSVTPGWSSRGVCAGKGSLQVIVSGQHALALLRLLYQSPAVALDRKMAMARQILQVADTSPLRRWVKRQT